MLLFSFLVSLGYSRKTYPPPPPTDGKLGILAGGGEGGLMVQEMQAGGGSQPKNSPSGLTLNFNLDRYTFFNHLKKEFAIGNLVVVQSIVFLPRML